MLTHETAQAYVETFFRKCGDSIHIICSRAVDRDSAVDVLFMLNGQETSFAVWVEHTREGTPYLYGEW